MKVLVAYFSHSGNTKILAEKISDITRGTIFTIDPVKVYPTDYQTVVDQAKKEINADFKPELKTGIENIDEYDTIFIGSPNWWGTVAPPVATFLTSYEFRGKKIIPFITHEGSRLGRTVSDINRLCPDSDVLEALPVRGSLVTKAENDVKTWLRETRIISQ